MSKGRELQQIIYELLKTQIEFGMHRYGDSLPTIKDASTYFLASIDTVRLAYLRLKEEGYITLRTCVGATVKIQYTDEEIRQNFGYYFSCRKESLLVFSQSVGILANFAQWFALKIATRENLDELERLSRQKDISPIYRMSRQLQLLYSPLGNDLLLQLLWQMFLYFQAPLVSISQNLQPINAGTSPFLNMISSVRENDWESLWDAVKLSTEKYSDGLRIFYNKYIPQHSSCKQIDFSWSIYKKTSQVCYSLCMDLLLAFYEGVYPVGSYLPSPKKLAAEKQVSLNTVRRTIALLNKLGATMSVNGVGTKVLPPLNGAENCDFMDPLIQKRLLEFLQSLHILAFSCRDCAQITLDSISGRSRGQWLQKLEKIKQSDIYDNLIYTNYEFISLHAPYPAICAVYAELTRQLLWGFPLRNLHGDREQTNSYYLPYLESLIDFLARADTAGFSACLEELQIAETGYVARYLSRLGMREAAAIVLPYRGDIV
ncbi:GntR family transcriptional regulator [Diplocloster modestus]|uniref:GntR family transcriptional regulator n=1 Tax=Diplocloster modestus TaxID=2850322 RepID=A0ABS6K905_9FIRM|nr:GntR family transcriptional regulator [Diplocloster modestus]MBU9726987.1 GntR family transcriptional regulator [Diplocloster modestus]